MVAANDSSMDMLRNQSHRLRVDDIPSTYKVKLHQYSDTCSKVKKAIKNEVDFEPLYHEDVAEMDGSEGRW